MENKELKFEQAYKRLEEIAKLLEDGNTSLEDSFKLYDEGQELVKLCHNILDHAEKKLKIIKEKNEGFELEEKEFD